MHTVVVAVSDDVFIACIIIHLMNYQINMKYNKIIYLLVYNYFYLNETDHADQTEKY